MISNKQVIQSSFFNICQHFSTNSLQTLCLLGFEGSDDNVLISDDKRFVSTDFQTTSEHTLL
ncbi:hypothetical protein [Bacteroides stercorirosoris]|uniref:hypothetical protein n=1 Tax=Bacteroides stercorirosoris TaxID=871324 RepID=UPI000A50E7DC